MTSRPTGGQDAAPVAGLPPADPARLQSLSTAADGSQRHARRSVPGERALRLGGGPQPLPVVAHDRHEAQADGPDAWLVDLRAGSARWPDPSGCGWSG
jgi:hypothetical protein